MGIHERDYTKDHRSPGAPFAAFTGTAVGCIILLNALVWLAQFFGPDSLTGYLATNASVFSGQVWRLVTAVFAHDNQGVLHLFMNMLFLFFFGRELERLYGTVDFCILYLGAGILSAFGETLLLPPGGSALGASGAVMGVVILYALHFPQRTVYFFGFVPLPIWLLALLFVAQDLMGFAKGGGNVGHFGHLAGAAFGLFYRFTDLRWARLRGWLGLGRGRRRRRKPKILQFPGSGGPQDAGAGMPEPPPPERDPVSIRIDQLLEKISTDGKDSLSEEEWEFLRDNSGHYKSR